MAWDTSSGQVFFVNSCEFHPESDLRSEGCPFPLSVGHRLAVPLVGQWPYLPSAKSWAAEAAGLELIKPYEIHIVKGLFPAADNHLPVKHRVKLQSADRPWVGPGSSG